MPGVWMNKQEQYTFSIVKQFMSGGLKRKEASKLLQINERSVTRIARRIEEKGMLGVKHGNLKRKPWNKLDPFLREHVETMMLTRYYDFNLTHALEIFRNEHKLKLSHETLRRICDKKGLIKRRKVRRAVTRRYRDRMPAEGLMLQMDGSPHRYNGKEEWCLISAIDDATSKIPYAEFFLSEDTLNCMTLLQKIIERVGIPECIYTDRAGWSGGGKRQNFTQFQRACDELGIRLLQANSPQAKGRIERSFQTVQDRIIPEMRLRNIKNIVQANMYLNNEFLPNYWHQKNVVAARDPENRYKRLPEHLNLNEILCIKEWRVVSPDQTISLNGKRMLIDEQFRYQIKGQKIEMRTYQNLTVKFFFARREISLRQIDIPLRAPFHR